MSRTAESIHKQHGKISKQTAHLTSPQDSITINHQDKIVGQDNDHLHLTDSHFSQNDEECDNPSSFSHDTGPFSLSDAITTVDLTTWGPDVRRHNQGGRSMGSTDITAVVSTRGGVARPSQVWQDGRYDRTSDVLAPHISTTEGGESMSQVGKLFEMPAKTRRRSATTGRRRRSYARKLWRRRRWPEEWKSRRTALFDLPQDGLGHEPGFPLSNR